MATETYMAQYSERKHEYRIYEAGRMVEYDVRRVYGEVKVQGTRDLYDHRQIGWALVRWETDGTQTRLFPDPKSVKEAEIRMGLRSRQHEERQRNRHPRDSQRQKVYNAECDLFLGSAGMFPKDNERGMQEFANEVVGSSWWKSNFPKQNSVTIGSTSSMKRSYATPSTCTIKISRHSSHRNHITILHELAHIAIGLNGLQGHGPEFTAAYIALVRLFHPRAQEYAERLQVAFGEGRVRVDEALLRRLLRASEELPQAASWH